MNSSVIALEWGIKIVKVLIKIKQLSPYTRMQYNHTHGQKLIESLIKVQFFKLSI